MIKFNLENLSDQQFKNLSDKIEQYLLDNGHDPSIHIPDEQFVDIVADFNKVTFNAITQVDDDPFTGDYILFENDKDLNWFLLQI